MALEFMTNYVAELGNDIPRSNNPIRELAFGNYETSLADACEFVIRSGGLKAMPGVALGDAAGVVGAYGGRPIFVQYFKHFGSIPSTEAELASAMGKYGNANAPEIIADLQVRALRMLEKSIAQAEELACSEALTTGTVNQYKADGTVLRSLTLWNGTDNPTIAAGTAWSSANANPVADLLGWVNTQTSKGGAPANVCLMAPDVFTAFMSNEKVKQALEMMSATLNPNVPAFNGARFMGHIAGLDVYVVGGSVTVGSTTKALIPAGGLILTGSNSENVMAYGGNRVKDGQTLPMVEGRRAMYSTVEGNPPSITHLLASSFIPVVHNLWDNVYISGLTASV